MRLAALERQLKQTEEERDRIRGALDDDLVVIRNIVDERDRLKAEVDRLRGWFADRDAELARLREALEEIASWNEGDVVTGKFDEPASAATARAALAQSPEEETK
jgi:chromosome segregation ATPase